MIPSHTYPVNTSLLLSLQTIGDREKAIFQATSGLSYTPIEKPQHVLPPSFIDMVSQEEERLSKTFHAIEQFSIENPTLAVKSPPKTIPLDNIPTSAHLQEGPLDKVWNTIDNFLTTTHFTSWTWCCITGKSLLDVYHPVSGVLKQVAPLASPFLSNRDLVMATLPKKLHGLVNTVFKIKDLWNRFIPKKIQENISLGRIYLLFNTIIPTLASAHSQLYSQNLYGLRMMYAKEIQQGQQVQEIYDKIAKLDTLSHTELNQLAQLHQTPSNKYVFSSEFAHDVKVLELDKALLAPCNPNPSPELDQDACDPDINICKLNGFLEYINELDHILKEEIAPEILLKAPEADQVSYLKQLCSVDFAREKIKAYFNTHSEELISQQRQLLREIYTYFGITDNVKSLSDLEVLNNIQPYYDLIISNNWKSLLLRVASDDHYKRSIFELLNALQLPPPPIDLDLSFQALEIDRDGTKPYTIYHQKQFINQQYRLLSLEYHPDKYTSDPSETNKRRITEKFSQFCGLGIIKECDTGKSVVDLATAIHMGLTAARESLLSYIEKAGVKIN